MTERILVTGAAGTIGRAVLAALAARPDKPEVVAFDREAPAVRRALRPFARHVRPVYGDITKPDSLAAACDGIDTVLHLAAVIPPRADDRPDLAKAVNLDGTKHLIATLERHAPEAFVVFASSVAVYGDRLASPKIRVGDRLTPSRGDFYAETKIAAEAVVQASALDWTIFRLTAVMGGHEMSPLMFHMPLETMLEIATPADTARAFANATGARAALAGRVFNLGGGESCRIDYRSLLDRSFALSGLGAFDLPDAAFATRNFHCGVYADGDDLEAILHFRRDDLDAYFRSYAAAQPAVRKAIARLLRRPIKTRLTAMSEPLRALQTQDKALCDRFFGPDTPSLQT